MRSDIDIFDARDVDEVLRRAEPAVRLVSRGSGAFREDIAQDARVAILTAMNVTGARDRIAAHGLEGWARGVLHAGHIRIKAMQAARTAGITGVGINAAASARRVATDLHDFGSLATANAVRAQEGRAPLDRAELPAVLAADVGPAASVDELVALGVEHVTVGLPSYASPDTDEVLALRRALAGLDTVAREVVQRTSGVDYVELTVKDAADVMGITLTAARSAHRRGMRQLRRALTKGELRACA